MIPYHGGIIWLTRQTEWEEELTTLKFPRTWWGGGGGGHFGPSRRGGGGGGGGWFGVGGGGGGGGGVKYGSRLWYGVDIF